MRRSLIAAVLALLLCIPAAGTNSPAISAAAAVLTDGSGDVLFCRGGTSRMQPASMTKIMTAYIVIKTCAADSVVEIKSSCTGTEGSSAYLCAGEKFTVEELLYALLLQSANDAALALADFASGSVPSFVSEMNRVASELGLHGTHFENPHGLPSDGHFSTPCDIAALLCECMKDPVFRRISGTKEYVIKQSAEHKARHFVNHNKLLFTYDGVCGGKTGYTVSSGRCLCSYYEKDGIVLCAVTMNAPRDWSDHMRLYEYGASLYEKVTLPCAGSYKTHVVGGIDDTAVCTIGDDVCLTVRKNSGEIKKTVCMRRFEYAPVASGELLGCLVFSQGDKIVYTEDLYADNKTEAKKDSFKDLIKWKR